MKKQVTVRAEAMLTFEVEIEHRIDLNNEVNKFIDEELVIDTLKKPLIDSDVVNSEVVTCVDVPYTKDELVDKGLEEIKQDIANGDLTALDELLRIIPEEYLKGYLAID